MFLQCQDWTQLLTIKQKVVWYQYAAFVAHPKPTKNSVITMDPYGRKKKQIDRSYCFHTNGFVLKKNKNLIEFDWIFRELCKYTVL